MKHKLLKNFLLCGAVGWCLEILWTGTQSLLSGKPTMMGQTSLLMFPIYGCASAIGPVYHRISLLPTVVRGIIYTGGIYLVEFLSGSILRFFHMCPWDYSRTPWNYKGLIRFDYAPLWFAAGLLFEKIVKKSS